jgi:hypothetical protein
MSKPSPQEAVQLKVLQEQVASDTTPTEEKTRDALEHAKGNTTRMGLPLEWVDGASGRAYKGGSVPLHRPSPGDIQNYAEAPRTVCGNCKHFELEHGRREIARQRFAERLVHEEEWQLQHLGVPLDHVGLCGMSNGEMAVTIISPGCDQWRDRKGRL